MTSSSIEPKWLTYARTQLGVREVPGPKSSATILAWAKRLGSKILGIAYTDDAVPWCGLFVAQCIAEAGLVPATIAVRASSWDAWGTGLSKRFLGAVVRFQRPGGGHVAILTGVSADGRLMRVLGGNQSDAVTETWIDAARCVAIRWPAGIAAPTLLAPVAKAGTVSRNEA